MALNWNFRSFFVSTSTNQHRILLLSRSKTFSDERIQGLIGLRERGAVHTLGYVSELRKRRLCVRCSLGHGPENEDLFRKQNDDSHRKSQRSMEVSSGSTISFTKAVVIKGLKIMLSIIVMLSLAVAGAPSVLSSRVGRRSILGVINKFIPGHADVQFLSLGWTKPIRAEGISLKGVDEKVVFSILKLETRASLWALARGKSGLGNRGNCLRWMA